MAEVASAPLPPGGESRPISVPAAARRTGYSENTIRRAARAGEIRAWRAGRRGAFRVDPQSLSEWIKPATEIEDSR